MNFDDEISHEPVEVGSDELLSDDNLRLPESANILVRVHAVQAWLTRRYQETTLEVGEAALALQELAQASEELPRRRRRERQEQEARLSQIQHKLTEAQQRLHTYEEAQILLEECIDHTSGERVLVEYYLVLEDLVERVRQESESGQIPRLQALTEVQHRVERVGVPHEEEDE
jgi:leucyl aminopeptidase (aminopeptidase T)